MKPKLKLVEVSSSSGWAPRARATALSTRKVPTSSGVSTPATSTNWVEMLLKFDWWSDGARKPVDAVARTATSSLTS